MNKEQIEKTINEFYENSGLNIINSDVALNKDVVGLKIFEKPLTGYISAEDKYLNELKDIPEAGIKMETPGFWLEDAKTVLSFFLPYNKIIRQSNIGGREPSAEWLHGRIQGQAFINALLENLQELFEAHGYESAVPLFDRRFEAYMGRDVNELDFGSNWSERHVAYAAGLGTFSLSTGFISENGVAGRLGSIITSAIFEPTVHLKKELNGNCIMCGKCAANCPVGAISLKDGKKNKPCSDYLDDIQDEHDPYYGCGKCQVGVPCEYTNPCDK